MRAVSAIVPAAGLSSRFGGSNKLLEPWGTRTVVGAVVDVLVGCGLPVLVVTGRDPELVAAAVTPVTTVFNEAFADGLAGSIACGIRSSPISDGYLIALGDMPDLQPEVVLRLIEQFQSLPHDAIVAPVYASEPNRPGHPVLFGSAHWEALSSLVGDNGARPVVEANKEKLRLVFVDGILADLDQPEDFRR